MESLYQNTTLFSPSTNRLLEHIENEGRVNLRRLMQLLETFHGEYGNSTHEQLFQKYIRALEERSNLELEELSREDWVNVVTSIVNPPTPVFDDINGRMFLIAAILSQFEGIHSALADIEWATQTRKFIEVLERELVTKRRIEFRSCLTEKGKELRQLVESPSLSEDHESLVGTPNISDAPATEDLLSRKPLARYIAKRLRYVYQYEVRDRNAFFMHVDGAWGAGKSTLLYFLENELEKPEDASLASWTVINFNAWEHQRLNPPWWFLMKTTYREAMKGLKARKEYSRWIGMGVLEHCWRISPAGKRIGVSIAALLIFLLSIYYNVDSEQGLKDLPLIRGISFLAFIWSLVQTAGSTLFSGSAKAAEAFVAQNSSDPMAELSSHFRRLVEKTGQPVAIFIDDLDRCQHEYGVKLLEGLHTIFKRAPVVYVIAADKRWLNKMYEQQYRDFSEAITTPTKPFGSIFLDKVFNYTLELPAISPAQQQQYWGTLLTGNKTQTQDEQTVVETEMLSRFVPMEKKLRRIDETQDPALKQRYREATVSSISILEQNRELEHKLIPFGMLIEPNPRVMKRLKNDIGTAKAISILYNQRVSEEQLVLWTIFKNQHPKLAECFWDNPDGIESKKTGNTAYDDLLKNKEVLQLFNYKPKGVTIDAEFIKKMRFQN